MFRSIKAAPSDSVVLLEDEAGGEIPIEMGQGVVAATESCIAIGCRVDADGETEFTLGAASAIDPGWAPAFQGEVATPNRKLVVRTVLHELLLDRAVSARQTRVRIWLNDPREPDRVLIGVDERHPAPG